MMGTTGTYLAIVLSAVGYQRPVVAEFVQVAEELHRVANELRSDLETYHEAEEPFVALLSSMFNNYEFEKTLIEEVDSGTIAGVGASSIASGPEPTR